MPKRKTQREKIIGKNEPANKKSLSERTAVTNDLLRNNESRQISDNLELSEIINKNFEGDEIDGFKGKIKELVKKIFNVIKGNVDSSGGENSSKKSGLVKVIIIIFSILLNPNLSSVKKISKTIKQSAKLVFRLWLERSSLSEGLPQDRMLKDSPLDRTM